MRSGSTAWDVCSGVIAGTMMISALGCKRTPSEAQAPPASATLNAAQESPSQPVAATSVAPQSLFGARFKEEKDSRPNASLPVERVFDALRAGGLELADVRQHLARPFEASYCVGAKIPRKTEESTIGLSVCEYKDAVAAQRGIAASKSFNGSFKHRETILHGTTTLTVLVATEDAGDLAMGERAKNLFKSAR